MASGRPVGAATPPPPRSHAPPAGTEFTVGARPQPQGAGVGSRKLSKHYWTSIFKVVEISPHAPAGDGHAQCSQSFALGVGPWGRRPATRHLKGNNLREGSRVAAPTAPKRNVENLKRVRSPAGATISKVCLRPIGAATPLPTRSSALHPDGTESAMGARPPP